MIKLIIGHVLVIFSIGALYVDELPSWGGTDDGLLITWAVLAAIGFHMIADGYDE